MALYKTTITIWSEYPGDSVDLDSLAQDACTGGSYCSEQKSVLVDDPQSDSDWAAAGSEFFDL